MRTFKSSAVARRSRERIPGIATAVNVVCVVGWRRWTYHPASAISKMVPIFWHGGNLKLIFARDMDYFVPLIYGALSYRAYVLSFYVPKYQRDTWIYTSFGIINHETDVQVIHT